MNIFNSRYDMLTNNYKNQSFTGKNDFSKIVSSCKKFVESVNSPQEDILEIKKIVYNNNVPIKVFNSHQESFLAGLQFYCDKVSLENFRSLDSKIAIKKILDNLNEKI